MADHGDFSWVLLGLYVKLDSSGLVLKEFENMPGWIVPKGPKPGYGSFGAIGVGCFWGFVRYLGRYAVNF